MKEVLYREAQSKDLPAIVHLLGDDDLGAQREKTGERLDPAYTQAFDAISADPHNCVYVAEHVGRVVACLQLTSIPNLTFAGAWRGQIEGVRVDKSLRGSGIGTEFLNWVLEKARNSNCQIVQLTMNATRTDTHRFYENLGFKATHTGFKIYF